MKQEERVSILKELKDELIEYKNEFELLKEFDTFDESFLANEPKCKDVKLISSYDLYISTVLPLEHKGIRYRYCFFSSFSFFVCLHKKSSCVPCFYVILKITVSEWLKVYMVSVNYCIMENVVCTHRYG